MLGGPSSIHENNTYDLRKKNGDGKFVLLTAEEKKLYESIEFVPMKRNSQGEFEPINDKEKAFLRRVDMGWVYVGPEAVTMVQLKENLRLIYNSAAGVVQKSLRKLGLISKGPDDPSP